MKDEMRPPTTPHGFTDEVTLEQALAAPSPALVKDLRSRSGDLVILGAGGKMGPSLAGSPGPAWTPRAAAATRYMRSPGSPARNCAGAWPARG